MEKFLTFILKMAGATGFGRYNTSNFKNGLSGFAQSVQDAEVTRVPSLCNGYFSYCGVWVYVKNGRLWKVKATKPI